MSVEIIPGNNCDFSTYLDKRVRAKLEHVQRCSFLIMEQCSGPLAVEVVSGNTAFSAPILPREREISLAHAQRGSFLIMEQCCGPWQ
jgi:hypothetical protein